MTWHSEIVLILQINQPRQALPSAQLHLSPVVLFASQFVDKIDVVCVCVSWTLRLIKFHEPIIKSPSIIFYGLSRTKIVKLNKPLICGSVNVLNKFLSEFYSNLLITLIVPSNWP